MALSKANKQEIVKDTAQLLESSKLTVMAQYPGTTVGAMQTLRQNAESSDTKIKVIKNRLVIKALQQSGKYSDIDLNNLTGQLLYAFNDQDEVAPAQVLNAFAKSNQTLTFVGAITANGQFIDAEDVVKLAELPSKDQLRAILIGTISAPLSGFVNIMAANARAVINVLHARAELIKV